MNETEKKTFSAPSPGELEQLTELHKAMGDYTRMRILWYLMQKDSCVSELAQKMEVTESAIIPPASCALDCPVSAINARPGKT